MTQSDHPADRTFQCKNCEGEIRIPYDLPPTSAPCPHCQVMTTSPAPPKPPELTESTLSVSGAPEGVPNDVRGAVVPSPAAVQTAVLPPSVLDIAAPAPVPETPVAVAETPVAVAETPVAVAETPVAVPETPVAVAETPVAVPETPVAVPETPIVVAETPIVVAETPVAVPETPAAVPQKAPVVPGVPDPERPNPAVVPAAEPAKTGPRESAHLKADAGVAPVAELLDDEDLRDEVAQVGVPAAPVIPGSKSPNVLVFILAMILVIAGLVAMGLYLMRSKEPPVPDNGERARVERNRYLREGWRLDASRQLQGFLHAATVEEKARHVLRGEAKLGEMRRFYRETVVEGQETPLAAFSHIDLSLSDRERGLFLMQYERPAQFNMREFFRPVAPLEVQYGLKDPDFLLSSSGMFENFATDPVRVMALFKRDDEGLKLDWDVFVQTKYRRLKEFSDFPRPGEQQMFRVMLEEDLSGSLNAAPGEERFYRLSDPYNRQDYVKVRVAVGSRLGQNLAVVNWVGLVVDQKPSRTATVVLEWTQGREPELRLGELVCWEFLDLGGERGNAGAVATDRGGSGMAPSAPGTSGQAMPPVVSDAGSRPGASGGGNAE